MPRQVVLCHELAGDDGDDAGQRARLRRVDPVDRRMRERAAKDRHVQHPRQLHVVDERALAADQPVVFLAPDVVSDATDLFGLGGHVESP
jgi:hypothetical protein